jgi:hypothetical protein
MTRWIRKWYWSFFKCDYCKWPLDENGECSFISAGEKLKEMLDAKKVEER